MTVADARRKTNYAIPISHPPNPWGVWICRAKPRTRNISCRVELNEWIGPVPGWRRQLQLDCVPAAQLAFFAWASSAHGETNLNSNTRVLAIRSSGLSHPTQRRLSRSLDG
jgi:hypothetical protein